MKRMQQVLFAAVACAAVLVSGSTADAQKRRARGRRPAPPAQSSAPSDGAGGQTNNLGGNDWERAGRPDNLGGNDFERTGGPNARRRRRQGNSAGQQTPKRPRRHRQ